MKIDRTERTRGWFRGFSHTHRFFFYICAVHVFMSKNEQISEIHDKNMNFYIYRPILNAM